MMRAPGSYAGLTVKQAELLSFLRHETGAGRSPSFEEMTRQCGLSSKGGIARVINALEERGYIERRPNRARSIIVFDEPQTVGIHKYTVTDLLNELASRGLQVRVV